VDLCISVVASAKIGIYFETAKEIRKNVTKRQQKNGKVL
jgi:hypothetical protein